MNKITKLLIVLAVLALCAAACGGGDDTSSGSGSVSLVYGGGDQSFSDSASAGVARIDSELGKASNEASANVDGSNSAELLQLGAEQSDIVVGVGRQLADAVKEVAGSNPAVNFAVVDAPMLGDAAGDNIVGLTFADEQGSFLVGAAAALKSETGTIGFIGGVEGMASIEKFEAGFAAGAGAVNPDIEVLVTYITEAPNLTGLTSPDKAKDIAVAQYLGGADVIYHVAGASGLGMFEAAREFSVDGGSKVWGIGVDTDQYNTVDASVQEYVLTSMLRRVDTAVFDIVKKHQDGAFAPGNQVYDLAVDGVGYSTSGGFLADIESKLEDFKAQIISGEIVVPTGL